MGETKNPLDDQQRVLALTGTPAPVVAALGAAFRAATQPSAPRLNELAGVVPRAGYETPDQVMNLVREGVKTYTDVVRAAGVKPE
ncbi:MAG: hypothetical protein INF74_11135 [Roseomonas sp.]|nr:hypothetical protein [Roseomonas sp.]